MDPSRLARKKRSVESARLGKKNFNAGKVKSIVFASVGAFALVFAVDHVNDDDELLAAVAYDHSIVTVCVAGPYWIQLNVNFDPSTIPPVDETAKSPMLESQPAILRHDWVVAADVDVHNPVMLIASPSVTNFVVPLST